MKKAENNYLAVCMSYIRRKLLPSAESWKLPKAALEEESQWLAATGEILASSGLPGGWRWKPVANGSCQLSGVYQYIYQLAKLAKAGLAWKKLLLKLCNLVSSYESS